MNLYIVALSLHAYTQRLMSVIQRQSNHVPTDLDQCSANYSEFTPARFDFALMYVHYILAPVWIYYTQTWIEYRFSVDEHLGDEIGC